MIRRTSTSRDEVSVSVLQKMPADQTSPKTIEAEVVVLPPDGKGKAPTGKAAEESSAAARIVAHWMDELFIIPGTNIRIGLDPIIGFFPGIGDALASSIGFVTLTEGIRQRVPLSGLMRMGLNILINDAVGCIPVVGDAFSIWFKSNTRNLALLNRWKTGDKTAVKRSSRIFMLVFFLAWIALLVFSFTVWFTLVSGTLSLLKSLF